MGGRERVGWEGAVRALDAKDRAEVLTILWVEAFPLGDPRIGAATIGHCAASRVPGTRQHFSELDAAPT